MKTYLQSVEHLRLTLIQLVNGARPLQHPVRQRALPVVYMCDNAEVPDEFGVEALEEVAV